jgi:hypothetical protein
MTYETRHRSTSVDEKGRSASVSTKKTPVQKKTITVQVIEALTSPEVLGKIIEDWSSWNIVPGVQDGLLNY